MGIYVCKLGYILGGGDPYSVLLIVIHFVEIPELFNMHKDNIDSPGQAIAMLTTTRPGFNLK